MNPLGTPIGIITFILGVGGCLVMGYGAVWGNLAKGVKKYCKAEVTGTYVGMETIVNKKLYGKKPVELPVFHYTVNDKEYEWPATYVSGTLPKLSPGDEYTVHYDPDQPEYIYVVGEDKDPRMVYPPYMVPIGAVVAVASALVGIAYEWFFVMHMPLPF